MRRAGIAALLLVLPAAGCRARADLVVLNGVVWTGASSGAPRPGAIAVRGDRILLVGDSAEIARYVGGATTVLDARGGLVVPGFADGHTHFVSGGFQLAAVDLRDAATPAEFVQRLGAYARGLAPGVWITGGDWDHESWAGAPLPRREWIDSVTPDNPVFVNRLDGHMALANSAALRAAGITGSTPTPPGGEIPRDPRTGEPQGIFKDEAMNLVWAAVPAPSPEQTDSALARALAHAAALGVTATSHVSATWDELASWRRLRDAGRLTLRAYVYLPLARWREVAETVRVSGAGDDRLRIAGLKGMVDGSAGSRTAYFFEPFADSADYAGLLVTPEDSLRAWIGNADSAGLQLAVHAIGDRANALLFHIYDSVAAAHGERDRRFRVEHAQHLRREEIELFGRMSVIASMQPYHAIDDGRWLEKRIGRARSITTYAFQSLLAAEAPLAFGSDWTVAPLDPLLGVYAAVTRRTIDGQNPDGWVPEQKITLHQTLRAYTAGNAYAVFAEKQWGTLAPGLLADLVVLDRDLFTMPAESLATAKVRYTVVGGRVVYRRQ
jgi:predicted amidohydrolase YtcJ